MLLGTIVPARDGRVNCAIHPIISYPDYKKIYRVDNFIHTSIFSAWLTVAYPINMLHSLYRQGCDDHLKNRSRFMLKVLPFLNFISFKETFWFISIHELLYLTQKTTNRALRQRIGSDAIQPEGGRAQTGSGVIQPEVDWAQTGSDVIQPKVPRDLGTVSIQCSLLGLLGKVWKFVNIQRQLTP